LHVFPVEPILYIYNMYFNSDSNIFNTQKTKTHINIAEMFQRN
jgi:hypothetical protein